MNLKYLLLPTAVLFFFAACTNLSSEKEAEKNQPAPDASIIHQLVEGSFEEIWSDLDTSSLLKYHTGDFLLLENGMVWDNDSIAAYQERALIEKQQGGYQRLNAFDYLHTEVSDSMIWTGYHNYGTWIKDGDTLGTAQWLESAVAVPTEDGWRLQMLHSTRIESE